MPLKKKKKTKKKTTKKPIPTRMSKAKDLLKKGGKGLKGPLGVAGVGLTTGFNVWMTYEILRMMGLLGAKGERDKTISAVVEGGLAPAWAEQTRRAGELSGATRDVEGMETMERFARGKQYMQEDFGGKMNMELDDLLAEKSGLLAKASLMNPTAQSVVANLVGQGLI